MWRVLFVFKWDGKEYPDEDRAAHRNPKRQEWVSWSLSEDGKTLATKAGLKPRLYVNNVRGGRTFRSA